MLCPSLVLAGFTKSGVLPTVCLRTACLAVFLPLCVRLSVQYTSKVGGGHLSPTKNDDHQRVTGQLLKFVFLSCSFVDACSSGRVMESLRQSGLRAKQADCANANVRPTSHPCVPPYPLDRANCCDQSALQRRKWQELRRGR